MKKIVFSTLIVVLGAAQIALAHDPRTVAKDFSHTLTVEGAGKLTLSYKSLHWNEPVYLNTKKNEQLRQRLNAGVWKKIGKLDTDFDVVIGGTPVPKGYLSFDLRPTSDTDSFVLEARSGKFRCSAEVKIPYLAPHEHGDSKPPEKKP